MPKRLAETRLAPLRRMAHIARAREFRPAGECLFRDLPDGKNVEWVRKAPQERRKGGTAVRDFREPGLAVAGRAARTRDDPPFLGGCPIGMPRKRVPEHHVEG